MKMLIYIIYDNIYNLHCIYIGRLLLEYPNNKSLRK